MDRLLNILKVMADFFSRRKKGNNDAKAVEAINARNHAMDDFAKYDSVSNATDIYQRH